MTTLSGIITPSNVLTATNTATLTNKTIQAANLTGATQFAGSSGTSGQVLTSAGAGAAPTWATPSAGALTLLATLSPTASANLDFLTTFSSTYDNYLIIGSGLLPTNNLGATPIVRMRFANSGTVDSGSNYFELPIGGGNGSTAQTFQPVTPSVLDNARGANFLIQVLNANAASSLKQATINGNSQSASTPTFASVGSTLAYIGSAVSGVRFYWSSGVNFIAGTVRVYGYSNS